MEAGQGRARRKSYRNQQQMHQTTSPKMVSAQSHWAAEVNRPDQICLPTLYSWVICNVGQSFYCERRHKSDIQAFVTPLGTIINGRQDLSCLHVNRTRSRETHSLKHHNIPTWKEERSRKKVPKCDNVKCAGNGILGRIFTGCSWAEMKSPKH